ncbi:VOC family protein [Saccharothrix longispora]|uniref:Enzyme related to lactoylglutathione lyase n=1 Tax=Saccharothrix longispora TaxID=33920 RepID=A0ABU1PUN2_9PSEU|nr:VOC family protein [Saccharothrix longispora]MDR6593844.1 putative enzyme related to lactoylglutathione lyase [Saccharothrix longispora]
MPATVHSPARGVRRVELGVPEPEPIAEFYAALLGWVIIAEPDGSFTGWVGDRLATRVHAGQPGLRVVFAGTEPRELREGMAVDLGRVLHGPWAPGPRAGEPCWVEHMGPTADDYWAGELGWEVRDPDADFTLYDAVPAGERRPVAGRLASGRGGWTCYYAVPDVARTAREVVELGGGVLLGPITVPTGTVAALTDPAGTVIAVLEDPPGWGGAWSA